METITYQTTTLNLVTGAITTATETITIKPRNN